MRKICILILVMAMMVSLAACSAPAVSNPKTKPLEMQTVESTEKNVISVEMNNVNFNSLEAYKKYFSSLDYVPNMVFYEDISQFGEYSSYSDAVSVGRDDPSCHTYSYSLIDASGYKFILRVRHVQNLPENAPELSYNREVLSAKGDLRKSAGEKNSIQELDGFNYIYSGGKLHVMFWYENGIKIEIKGGSFLNDYPNTTDTLVGKLLNSETAPEAIKTIKAMNITEGLPRGTADANITPAS